MGINLASQKITFTSGKILYQGSARSDGSVANGYAIGITYNYGTVTSCPAGMQVLSSTSPQSGFIGGLTPVGSSGTMYCAYP